MKKYEETRRTKRISIPIKEFVKELQYAKRWVQFATLWNESTLSKKYGNLPMSVKNASIGPSPEGNWFEVEYE